MCQPFADRQTTRPLSCHSLGPTWSVVWLGSFSSSLKYSLMFFDSTSGFPAKHNLFLAGCCSVITGCVPENQILSSTL